MPQFSDDLFLGTAQTYMGVNTNSALGDPSSMDLGVGPVGRVYVWDTVPAAKAANNLVTSTTPTVAGSLTITAGAGVTAVTLANGSSAYQLDVPRAVSVATASGTHASANLTVSGYDYYGQAMSEVIATGTLTMPKMSDLFSPSELKGASKNKSYANDSKASLEQRITTCGLMRVTSIGSPHLRFGYYGFYADILMAARKETMLP